MMAALAPCLSACRGCRWRPGKGEGCEIAPCVSQQPVTAGFFDTIVCFDPFPTPALPPFMPASDILIRGAREHNLRDVDLLLPRNRLICFTGVSGSGKSSLAFDTLYAEGQRRYVESLSSFARQFLGPDAQARRGPDLRPEPGDLDFAEDGRAKPPLHGRHDHRDLRLSAGAVRPGGQGALPAVRPADHGPNPRADHRSASWPCRPARGSASWPR